MTKTINIQRKTFRIPLAIFTMLPAFACAEIVTLNPGDAFNTSSIGTIGNWSNAAMPSSGQTYEVSLRYLRTPRTGAAHTFPGDSLALKTGGSLLYKGTTSQTFSSTLVLDGGYVRSGQNDLTTFTLAGTIDVTATGGGLSPDQSPISVDSVVSGTLGELWLTDSVNVFGDPNVSGPGKRITFNAVNTFTGNLRVDTNTVGAIFSGTSTWAFKIGASGVNNTISGVGKINLNGLFSFDLTGAGTTLGDSWDLVNHSTLTETYDSTFLVEGFTDNLDDTWSKDIGGGLIYRFDEGTGTLAVVERSTPFEGWAILKGLDGTAGKENGPANDPDPDGASNMEEFAFNGNPLSGSDNGIRNLFTADTSHPGTDKELVLTIAVRSGAPGFTGSPAPASAVDGVTYSVDGSLNLSAFTSTVSIVDPITTGLPDLTGSGYEYRSFSLDGSAGLPGKGFLRAKAKFP